MAMSYKTGGRQPGSKNVKTKEREGRVAEAAVAAAASALDVEDEAKGQASGKAALNPSSEIEKAPISAKDLLLTAIRVAWEDA